MNGEVSIQKVVVALEECGFQCQYVDGTVIATRGTEQRHFVEDSHGNAVGTFPADVQGAVRNITEAQVARRFSQQALYEMGYGQFSPSADKPTGTEEPSSNRFDVDSGDRAVTSDNPDKPKGMDGIDDPVDDDDLPDDFTGGSDNNEDADIPSTGGGTDATTVGAHGGSGGGKGAGPKSKKPEKTQPMAVANNLYQMDNPDSEKSGDYTGSEVGAVSDGGSRGGGGRIAKQGSFPADLPSKQDAQTTADIPTVKKGKMTVTGATVESVLDAMFEQQDPDELQAAAEDEAQRMVEQYGGQTLALLTQSQDGAWAVGGTLESNWDPQQYSDMKMSAQDHASTGGEARIIATPDSPEEVREAVTENPNLDPSADLGGTEVFMTEDIRETVGTAIAKGAEVVGDVAKGVVKGAGTVAKKVASPVVGVAGDVVRAAGTGVSAAGDALDDDDEQKKNESIMRKALRTFPRYSGILEAKHPGPFISPATYEQIDLAEAERMLTPTLLELAAERILDNLSEQDEEGLDDAPPEPGLSAPPGGEDDVDIDIDAEGGEMPPEGGEAPEDDAGLGGPPELSDMGAPEPAGGGVDIDIGGGPSPQPSGGEPEATGEPVPEPELPADDRWKEARDLCPDCDDSTLSKIVQAGIVGDLYNELTKNLFVHFAKTKQDTEKQALAASMNAHSGRQVTTKGSKWSGTRNTSYSDRKQLESLFQTDPHGFLDALMEGLMADPSKVGRAAALVLGLQEQDDYKRRNAETAAQELVRLKDEIYGLREQLGTIMNSTVGDILTRVKSPIGNKGFAARAQQMLTQLNDIHSSMDLFLQQLDANIDEFNRAHQAMGVSADSDQPGMSAPPEAMGPEEPGMSEPGMEPGMSAPPPPPPGEEPPMGPEGEPGMSAPPPGGEEPPMGPEGGMSQPPV